MDGRQINAMCSKIEDKTKYSIDQLSKMPSMVIDTAYLYATNYTSYGENVTEKWVTATQQSSALEKAYRKGYYDALQKQTESKEEACYKVLLFLYENKIITDKEYKDLSDRYNRFLGEDFWMKVKETESDV